MDKIIPNNATRISLNDRFTGLLDRVGSAPKNKINRGRSRSRSRARVARTGSGSIKNRKLVEDLEKKLKLRLAMRLKQRSIRGGQRQPLGARRLNRGARPVNRGRNKNVNNLTMAADMEIRSRRRRSNSVSSVHSRLGGPQRNTSRRPLKRSNSVTALKRSNSQTNLGRSRSRNRQRSNSRNRQRSISRNQQRSVSRGRQNSVSQTNLRGFNCSNTLNRSISRSRSIPNRRPNRGFKAANLRRNNSKTNLAQNLLGINSRGNPINGRKNNQRIVRQGNNRNQLANRRGFKRAARRELSRNPNGQRTNQAKHRSRSRIRGGSQNNQGRNGQTVQRRGRSRTRRGAAPKTKEQLDKELDQYMSNSNNDSAIF